MQDKRILEEALCLGTGVIESVWKEGDGTMVASCRPRKGQNNICPHCGRHRPVYDCSPSPRRWRTMDQGPVMAFIEYATVRVECPEHGVVVAAVPWAEHASRFTREFGQQVAWLACKSSKTATAKLMRIDWASVGGICKRVYDGPDAEAGDRFGGLLRIGVDETSYKKGRKYMTVVLDHDANRVIWCAKGHEKAVLKPFLEQLGEEQRASIRAVTADGARWIAELAEAYCPNAERVMDPFHVVSWMTDVVDELRKQARRKARAAERRGELAAGGARAVKDSRCVLLKNPEDLTEAQGESLERVAREDKPCTGPTSRSACGTCSRPAAARRRGSGWSRGSPAPTTIDEVKELSKKVRRHKEAIVRAVELGISNARFEAINNKINLTVRMAYGFRNFDNLVALVMLRCSNLPIALPGR